MSKGEAEESSEGSCHLQCVRRSHRVDAMDMKHVLSRSQSHSWQGRVTFRLRAPRGAKGLSEEIRFFHPPSREDTYQSCTTMGLAITQ
ncbi:hypothetical protein SRHO_G00245640 [Serrasalmus rhombeus]